MSVGNRIKELRKKAGIYNQEELAFRLGTARQTVSSWERDIFLPDSKTLKRLAEELNTTVSYLLGEEETRDMEISEVERKRSFGINEDAVEYQIGMRCSKDGVGNFMIRRLKYGKVVQYELSDCDIPFLENMIEEIWERAEMIARH